MPIGIVWVAANFQAMFVAQSMMPLCGYCFFLAKFCQTLYHERMGTMNISLPDTLKSFVDEQVAQRGYGTSSEYVRELIRKDADLLYVRGLLLKGAASAPTAPADASYFTVLRARVQARSQE
jgi:antitoxin ParD1/3/4